MVTRFEALKAVDDIFNYCEEIDNNIPENERSGYKMLPDILKIRKYIIENTRPHGEWVKDGFFAVCSNCDHELQHYDLVVSQIHFCPNCGADMREGESE